MHSCRASWIDAICETPHALLPTIHRSTHCVWFIMAGYPIVSSHPLPMLLEQEMLILMDSLQIPCDARQSVHDRLSGLLFDHFTTPWSSEHGDAPRGCNRASFEMHLSATIERVWRCTFSWWWCELRGRNWASLEIHLEAVIEQVWRCTWRPWWSEIGGVLGGAQSGGCRSGGRRDGS